jgi:replicative DNA helicase
MSELEQGGEVSKTRTYILYMDNDDAGKAAKEKLTLELDNKGYIHKDIYKLIEGNTDSGEVSILKDSKDANDALVKNQDQFKSAISYVTSRAAITTGDEREQYDLEYENKLAQAFDSFYIKKPKIPTGFKGLDEILDGGLYPALYILGAAMGAGKTTLLLQMADYIATDSSDVLFFSGEMSFSQILARSLSRLSYETCRTTSEAFTARTIDSDVAGYAKDDPARKRLKEIFETYAQVAVRLPRIYDDVLAIKDIKETIATHAKLKGTKPVVFIDYLQKLKGETSRDKRQEIDEILRELKLLVTSFQIPIIAISSLNRDAFRPEKGNKAAVADTCPVQMLHFKESGNIEYEGDIVMGLSRDGSSAAQDERLMRLQVLKNKFGRRHGDTDFIELIYNAKFNHFRDVTVSDAKDKTRNKNQYYLSKEKYERDNIRNINPTRVG